MKYLPHRTVWGLNQQHMVENEHSINISSIVIEVLLCVSGWFDSEVSVPKMFYLASWMMDGRCVGKEGRWMKDGAKNKDLEQFTLSCIP